MTRILEELPCGCLIGEEGIIPCCYDPEDKTDLHKRCIQLYFREYHTVKEVCEIIERETSKLEDYEELDPNDFEEVQK